MLDAGCFSITIPSRAADKEPAVRNGIPLLARQKSAIAVTPALVNQMRDELL